MNFLENVYKENENANKNFHAHLVSLCPPAYPLMHCDAHLNTSLLFAETSCKTKCYQNKSKVESFRSVNDQKKNCCAKKNDFEI